ncbi:tRNA synthetases class II family protein [Mycobacterium kansasii]|uniref:alanine--tRNA ligase n=1 Tax=Mycobacterium kansasii TaxID=1768 RepID=A0A1V3WGG3_MYCKA|nr:tRNA synthetases class II family protein [Mycobacterium kansasii]
MQTHEIRKRFLDHFVKAGHTEVPSASVILDDPNLLFVNAGMVQFVPYFLGQRTPPYPTATSIQKCIRTPDIDEVGITTRHNTFFQMAGNFSFGDYFKRGAIELAWSLLTNGVAAGGYGLDPERLWATVYLDDDEAAGLWQDVAGLPPERIQRRGMADNYWSMGIPGPCGRHRRSTTTAAPTTAPKVGPSSTKTATSRCGTSSSCRTSAAREPPKRTTRSWVRCPARTSTPAWGSSGSRWFCKTCTTSTRPTSYDRSWMLWPWSPRAPMTPEITPTTCGTASSPTTAAPQRS